MTVFFIRILYSHFAAISQKISNEHFKCPCQLKRGGLESLNFIKINHQRDAVGREVLLKLLVFIAFDVVVVNFYV